MRLVSYNIHKGVGGRDRRCRLERIIEVLEGQNPDLLCLQEVTRGARRSRYDNQAGKLAHYFRFDHSLYQTNVQYKLGGYGNLLLSRWPFRQTHQISLRMRQKKNRGAQLTVVETPEGPLHLVNWHLGLGDQERRWQVAHLLEHRLFAESASLPTMIAGDVNDWRNTLAGGALKEAGFRLLTHPPSRFRTFPAWLPAGALDKAFARDGEGSAAAIDLRRAHVVGTALAKRASDHLPLVLDFQLGAP